MTPLERFMNYAESRRRVSRECLRQCGKWFIPEERTKDWYCSEKCRKRSYTDLPLRPFRFKTPLKPECNVVSCVEDPLVHSGLCVLHNGEKLKSQGVCPKCYKDTWDRGMCNLAEGGCGQGVLF